MFRKAEEGGQKKGTGARSNIRFRLACCLRHFDIWGNVYHVVDSETNDVLNVNVHHKEALANTSRSIIEKYLTLKPSTVEVGSKDSASTVQSISTTPNCRYCGKGLTHDRSHCPLLRTKLVQTIEQRLEDVRANDNEDPEVWSNTISALEAALERRRPATANKEQRMTVSNHLLNTTGQTSLIDMPCRFLALRYLLIPNLVPPPLSPLLRMSVNQFLDRGPQPQVTLQARMILRMRMSLRRMIAFLVSVYNKEFRWVQVLVHHVSLPRRPSTTIRIAKTLQSMTSPRLELVSSRSLFLSALKMMTVTVAALRRTNQKK